MYQSTSPEMIDKQVISPDLSQNPIRLEKVDPKRRYYFEIISETGASTIVSERLINLEGTRNFRDLGGYRTTEGRVVKWGQFYRADKISRLSSKDLIYLENLGIRTVCDFRGPEEVKAQPDRLPKGHSLRTLAMPIYDPSQSARDILTSLRKARSRKFDSEAYMMEANRNFAIKFRHFFQELIHDITNPENTPLLFHCTGGKDRTGFAAAMILTVLGVPQETIMKDYLASNHYRFRENQQHLRMGTFYGVNTSVLAPILEVRAHYIESAYEAIHTEYGSMERYLEEGLEVDSNTRQFLKDTYLY